MSDKNLAEVVDSEEQLIKTAQDAVSRCNWVVGECAAIWTRKYARGRTDADFGALVGMSTDQVFQRRRAWETFGDVYQNYSTLKWSHFYVALKWDDAPECLTWADENQASVAEMRAWRRLQHGEDLTADPDEADVLAVNYVPTDLERVRQPGDPTAASVGSPGGAATSDVTAEAAIDTASSASRGEEAAATSYAPYRKGAGSPAPSDADGIVQTATKTQPSTLQIVRRMTATLERYTRLLNPEFARQFDALPEKVRVRFAAAARDFSAEASKLH